MSQQSLRQASIRAVTGTTYTYEGDWIALFDLQGIASGTFNERLLGYINTRLGTAYTEINGAMAAMALAEGVTNFQAIGTFTAASAPSIADQTIDFGRLTRSGAGGVIPTNTGGTITGSTTNTLTGTNSSHWAIASDGTITPTASFVASPQASYTLTATVYNSAGSSSCTLTINTTANAYSFISKAELDAIMALGDATVSGKTLLGRNVSITGLGTGATTFKNRAFTSTVTLTSHSNSARVLFDALDINNTQNLTVTQVKVSQAAANNLSLISVRGLSDSIVIDDCEICGDAVMDVNADYSAGWLSNFYGVNTGSSGGDPVGLTVQNCDIHDVRVGVSAALTGNLVGTGNSIYRVYEDGFKIGRATGHTGSVTISWNSIYNFFGRGSDTGNPHCDGIQLLGGSTDWTNISIIGNRIWRGSARGAVQGIFMDDLSVGTYYTATIQNNFVCVGASNSIRIQNAKDCVVQNNTAVNPQSGFETPFSSTATILVGSSASSGSHLIIDNISEALTATGTYTTDNNVTLGLNGATIAYSSVFDGPTFGPDLVAEVMASFNMKEGGSADNTYNAGAIGTGYSDFSAKTYTAPRSGVTSPSNRVTFSDMLGAVISTQTTGGNVLPGIAEAA